MELKSDYYQPHKQQMLNNEMLSLLRKELVGSLGEVTCHRVDGQLIRDRIDIDFALGGNYARYNYVPERELWVEDTMSETEVAPSLLHEYVEAMLMEKGLPYEAAHEQANREEARLRADPAHYDKAAFMALSDAVHQLVWNGFDSKR